MKGCGASLRWIGKLVVVLHRVSGHGYVVSPRSRNWIAHEDGIESVQEGSPPKEYCPHCLNRNSGVCGMTSSTNYDQWLDSVNKPMLWMSEAVYNEGDAIRIRSILTTHHGGHMEVRACPLGRASTWDCFEDPKHSLKFVQDLLYNMPADPIYPERGYFAGWNMQLSEFDMEFKLPNGLQGEQVLLQWRYITGNSCLPPGYDSYFLGNNSRSQILPLTFWVPTLPPCTLPFSRHGEGLPEQFFNCFEISVLPRDGTNTFPVTDGPEQRNTTITVESPSLIARRGPRQDSRMIAYVGNWLACPSDQQLQQYSHLVLAFAVSYTWAPQKNICSSTCQISTPPICVNMGSSDLINKLHAKGKKVILSFGGAGMGGSWPGDVNDCWEACFGREEQVVSRLVQIAQELNLDGVDIDYEYFYENNQNGSGFAKGMMAIKFLRDVTVGLRTRLPPGSIVTHAPMDDDLLPGRAYYELLKDISYTLDFIMPQYYNGVTRPAIDGFNSANVGRMSAASHYRVVSENLFGGDASRVVFGFCINDCSATGSNANSFQAVTVVNAIQNAFDCHGGVFFWVSQHDIDGSWSSAVNHAMNKNRGCSGGVDPNGRFPTPAPTLVRPPVTVPTVPSPSFTEVCCPNGMTGFRPANQCRLFYRCTAGSVEGGISTCGVGLLFDQSVQVCNWANQVDCNIDPCPTILPPKKVRPARDDKDNVKLFSENQRGNLKRRHLHSVLRGQQ